MSEHSDKGGAAFELGCDLDGSSYLCRENLQDILARELLGPSDGEREVVDASPKSKYILGRIAPVLIDTLDAEADEHAAGDDDDTDEDADTSDTSDGEDGDASQRRGLMIPSSMGLRFQVPSNLDAFTVYCSWGRYDPEKTGEQDDKGRDVRVWRRTPFDCPIRVPLDTLTVGRTASFPVKDSVVLRVDRYDEPALDRCLIEIALCNDMETENPIPVSKWMFQTRLEVDANGRAVFLPVHDWNEDDSFADDGDVEQRSLRLQYRDRLEFAVGRTCSADWTVSPENTRRAVTVRTTWLPTADIPQTEARNVDGVELDMTKLAAMDGDKLREVLMPIAVEYAAWLDEQQESIGSLPEHLRSTARETVAAARLVSGQLRDGIEFLCSDEEAQRCFRFMNTVMAEQRVHTQIGALRANDETLSDRKSVV